MVCMRRTLLPEWDGVLLIVCTPVLIKRGTIFRFNSPVAFSVTNVRGSVGESDKTRHTCVSER